jgi:hypothetical protein
MIHALQPLCRKKSEKAKAHCSTARDATLPHGNWPWTGFLALQEWIVTPVDLPTLFGFGYESRRGCLVRVVPCWLMYCFIDLSADAGLVGEVRGGVVWCGGDGGRGKAARHGVKPGAWVGGVSKAACGWVGVLCVGLSATM